MDGTSSSQLEGHVHHVAARFAHADDQAAAGLDAAFLRRDERPHPVRVVVGAADLGVVGLARVEIVVEAIETGVGEQARVLLFEDPDRQAHLDREALLHAADDVGEPARTLERGAASRQHQAIARGAREGGALRPGQDLVIALQRVLADRGGRVTRLGAVPAVLGTQAALHVVEDVHHDLAPEATPARNEGGVQQGQQLHIVAVQDPERLGVAGRIVAERTLGESRIGFEHGRTSCRSLLNFVRLRLTARPSFEGPAGIMV